MKTESFIIHNIIAKTDKSEKTKKSKGETTGISQPHKINSHKGYALPRIKDPKTNIYKYVGMDLVAQ